MILRASHPLACAQILKYVNWCPPMMISVVLAYYSGDNAEYFEEALHSVYESTYRPIQLVVVADGFITAHHNDCLLKFEAMTKSDSNFLVCRHQLPTNRGPAAARNLGIKNSQGDFIAIMDADDRMHKDRLEKQLKYLLQHDSVDLVGSFYFCIDESGSQVGQVKLPVGASYIKTWSSFVNPIANPCVLARAQVFRENWYPEHIRVGEDYYLWVQLLLNGKNLDNVPEFLLSFRKTKDFLKKRTGISWVKSDFYCRLISLRYQTGIILVMGVLFLPISTIFRLMPPRLLRIIYSLRENFSFLSMK